LSVFIGSLHLSSLVWLDAGSFERWSDNLRRFLRSSQKEGQIVFITVVGNIGQAVLSGPLGCECDGALLRDALVLNWGRLRCVCIWVRSRFKKSLRDGSF
jgi:hypothetical protein